MNRAMQNLTAKYNYIYNSNLILNNYEEVLYQGYQDNYNDILPVYTNPEKFNPSAVTAPPANEKELDAIIAKARIIVAEKSFSNYIDESYLLIGKSNYLKANYFIAQEFFDYTAKTYTNNPEVLVSALNWKARSLMQLNNFTDAALVLDTVYNNLSFVKKHTAEPMATIAQMYIYQDKIEEAIPMLERAIKESELKRNRIRWTYILAQLYEKQKNYQEALHNYTEVQQSNAAFELYFNANLNKIKINGLLNGEKLNRKKQLLVLLKDDKNLDYKDQIYFQVAESYTGDSDYPAAEKYYNLSVSNSTKNRYQKGLSYLKIADLNFKELHNFLKAKLYYDSAVSTLPKNYSGYSLILKKSQNLEYLTKRYDIIAMQDTLQLLAGIPAEERVARVKQIINIKTNLQHSQETASTNNQPVPFGLLSPAAAAQGTFYFNNSTAISNGYSDFLKRWGNRALEDNWRQSIKSSAQTTAENIGRTDDETITPLNTKANKIAENTDEISEYIEAIPLSPGSMAQSDQKIIDAYDEIANFYLQELNDQQEAVKIYELLLARFPENNRLPSIYYSLYLAHKNGDPAKSLKYRDLVLTQFPNSVYAKTITDPQFSVRQSEIQVAVLQKYNALFSKYEQKQFPQVITDANAIASEYPGNEINTQAAYLKAIAIGRMHPVDSLVKAFRQITGQYPEDKIIVPLINDHLAYIAQHMAEFRKRKVALPDFDNNEPRFFAPPPHATTKAAAPPAQSAAAEVAGTPAKVIPAVTEKAAEIVLPSGIFSTAIAETYYFVIDVEDASLTLSSSRFGIGQFNRGNYADSGLKHRLLEFDNDQLIYIGNFSSFAEVKSYAEGITPYLKQIMKVPAGIYSSFIISKENFEKLQSKSVVTQYLEFFKNNYTK